MVSAANFFYLSFTSSLILENVVPEFAPSYRQQGYSSNPYLYDIQLFESENLPLALSFWPGTWKGEAAERKITHVKQMKEKARKVEMYRNLKMTYILVYFSPKIWNYKANPESIWVSFEPRFSKVRGSQHLQAWPSET